MARRAIAKYTVKERLYPLKSYTFSTPSFFDGIASQLVHLEEALRSVSQGDKFLETNRIPRPVLIKLNGFLC